MTTTTRARAPVVSMGASPLQRVSAAHLAALRAKFCTAKGGVVAVAALRAVILEEGNPCEKCNLSAQTLVPSASRCKGFCFTSAKALAASDAASLKRGALSLSLSLAHSLALYFLLLLLFVHGAFALTSSSALNGVT